MTRSEKIFYGVIVLLIGTVLWLDHLWVASEKPSRPLPVEVGK